MKCLCRLLAGWCLLVTLVSCSAKKEGNDFDVEALDVEMKSEGWSRFEILGEPGKTVAKIWLESKTAKTVRASWVTNGKLQEKAYQQTNSLFYVATYEKADGDTFSVVFTKPSTSVKTVE